MGWGGGGGGGLAGGRGGGGGGISSMYLSYAEFAQREVKGKITFLEKLWLVLAKNVFGKSPYKEKNNNNICLGNCHLIVLYDSNVLLI